MHGQHVGWPERSVGQTGWWRQDRFRSWGLIAKRGIRSHSIVMPAPSLNQNLSLAKRREDLDVQELVSELRVQVSNGSEQLTWIGVEELTNL